MPEQLPQEVTYNSYQCDNCVIFHCQVPHPMLQLHHQQPPHMGLQIDAQQFDMAGGGMDSFQLEYGAGGQMVPSMDSPNFNIDYQQQVISYNTLQHHPITNRKLELIFIWSYKKQTYNRKSRVSQTLSII